MPRQLIYHNRYFLGIFSIYLIAGAFSFIWYQQGHETLFMDSHHTPWMDFIFVFFTQLAEAISLSVIFTVLVAARLRYFIMFAINMMVVGAVIIWLKYVVFADHVRPALFFGSAQHLNFIKGRPILSQYSFPSGHTATAFASALMLAIFIRRTWASLVLLCLALLVGLSRIYLLEHFWVDVYFGSLVGVTITLLVYIALQRPIMHRESRVLDFSLWERFTKRQVKQ